MLSIDVEASDLLKWFGAIRDRLDDPEEALAVLIEDVNRYEADLFGSQGGGQWAADDPATALLKGSARVLVDSGNLLAQMTNAQVDDSDSVILDAGDAPYIKPLRAGANGSPPRDPAPTPPERELEDWAEHMLDVIVDGA